MIDIAKKSSAYWKKRFLDLEAASNAYGQDAFRQIEPAFDKAQREIQKEIESWYGRYAKNNQITMKEARRQLSTTELKEFRWDVQEYIKYGEQNALDASWMKELENASARFHVNRLEALKIRTQHAAEVAFGNELDSLDAMSRKVFTEDYYHSIFELQKGFNIGWEIGQIDERKLNRLITKPWAADGKNFSERIWQQRSQLVSELHTQLTRCCILGKAPDDAIKAISKKFNTTKNQAGRLVMTEQAYFHSIAQKEAFAELDVEEFEIVATLDNHTSEICQDMDGQHFPMSQYEPGVTAPPFHVWCRTVTVPYFEDNFTGERAARGADGKTYYVPDNMTYKQWKKSLVDGDTSELKPIDPGLTIKMGTLSDAKKLGQTHSDAMKTILEAAPENVQKIWNQYVDRLEVVDAHSKKGAFCDYTKGVSMNIDQVSKGDRTVSRITHEWEQGKKPYYTAFHEFGHNISSWMAQEVTGYHFKDIADVFQSKKFRRTYATGGDVGYTLTEMMKQEGLAYFNSIFDRLKKEAKANGLSARTVRKYHAWDVIKNEILEKPIVNCSDVSDMWDGISNGSCLAHYGHTNSRKDYWKWISVGTEAFAEMYSATVMNPESVKMIKHYFPKSYELFEEILEEMGVD